MRLVEKLLTDEAKQVLALAKDDWRRMPSKHFSVIDELEHFGFVQLEVQWQWSKTDPGSGRHVQMWRKTPNEKIQGDGQA